MNDKQKVELPVVAWMTHHDEPMLYPTEQEASAYCEDDEPPLPLVTLASAEACARAMVEELVAAIREYEAASVAMSQASSSLGRVPHDVGHRFDIARHEKDAVLARIGEKGNG